MTFQQEPQGNGMQALGVSVGSASQTKKAGKCKGPGAEAGLASLRKSNHGQEVGMAGGRVVVRVKCRQLYLNNNKTFKK